MLRGISLCSVNESGHSAAAKDGGRARGIIIGLLVGLVVIAGIAYLADILTTRDRVPRGTTVGGVSISGMSPEEARSTLERELADASVAPVTVTAGPARTVFDPVASGLAIDWDATIGAVPAQSWNPVTRVSSFFSDTEVPIVSLVDAGRFGPTLDTVVAELHRDPVSGDLRIEDGEVRSNPTVKGQSVDRTHAETSITENWLNPEGVSLEAADIDAPISQERIDELAEGPAAEAVSGPFTVHGDDGVDGVIPVARMGEILSFPEHEGDLRITVDHERAREILAEGLAETEVEPQNARISFATGTRVVTPDVSGHGIDWEQTLSGLEAGITGTGPREVDAVYEETTADFTAADAQVATFDQVMGEFTTGDFSAASGTNIRRTAQMVDGAVVSPGEVFSLNNYTGPRGAAQGFVESGIILDGRSDTAVGGGISQFATTLYNAYYFAGLEDVTHTPHSYYISRYPAGREATIFDGAIDLQFRNNTEYPVMIRTSADSSSVTVQILGVDTTSVRSINNGRWASTQPHTVRLSGGDCVPSTGAPGFTTSDTRVISDLAGNELTRETVVTVYDPSPNVVCS